MSKLEQALLEFQKAAPSLHKDAKNPHFGNAYLSLDGLLAKIRPALNKQGLLVIQSPTLFESFPALRTRIIHAETGEFFEDVMPLAAQQQTPQAQGSAITYARRYSLMAMLGLVADDDDDGNASEADAKKQQGAANGGKLISDAQRKRLFAIARENAVDNDLLKQIVKDITGADSTDGIPMAKYDELVATVQAQEVPFL